MMYLFTLKSFIQLTHELFSGFSLLARVLELMSSTLTLTLTLSLLFKNRDGWGIETKHADQITRVFSVD